MSRKLAVRREVLAELSPEEARSVVGGVSGYSCVGVCMTGVEECLTRQWCLGITEEVCAAPDRS
ncbi:MAG TPA: hypothetical protein VNQ77_05345 [Frankiaceae bacterium]|nr:hypothetical protein [Frankiaceae bacterium]